jgi:hypothetical protein
MVSGGSARSFNAHSGQLTGVTNRSRFAIPISGQKPPQLVALTTMPVPRCHGFRTNSGSLAIFAAIRRASSLVSNLAANRLLISHDMREAA